jgi:hypothetical protein
MNKDEIIAITKVSSVEELLFFAKTYGVKYWKSGAPVQNFLPSREIKDCYFIVREKSLTFSSRSLESHPCFKSIKQIKLESILKDD